MDLHQGDCILLKPDALASQPPASRPHDPLSSPGEPQFQVIGVDRSGDRCWVRRWPLVHRGSPVFEVALHQVRGPAPHRPLSATRRDG
ncbi:MAG: hypothetical protein ACO3B3_03600 [Cyanobium sp.]